MQKQDTTTLFAAAWASPTTMMTMLPKPHVVVRVMTWEFITSAHRGSLTVSSMLHHLQALRTVGVALGLTMRAVVVVHRLASMQMHHPMFTCA